MGGACNMSCIYCDSPDRSKQSKITRSDVAGLLSSKSFNWVFFCGLGEPTAKDNRDIFASFLHECQLNDVRASVFTNALELNNEILEFVDSGTLNLLVKCDSLEPNKLNRIYGGTHGERCLEQIQKLEEHVQTIHGNTNIGLSIVPTSLNQGEISEIVQFSIERGFYPLIGDLECSGMSKEQYASLKLKESDLWTMRNRIENILGERYRLPICPSVIAGLHINHDQDIIVDKATGLSCHWFWLRVPDVLVLDNLLHNNNYEYLVSHILDYRNQKLKWTEDFANQINELPFGGCGGDMKDLLTAYTKIQKNLKNQNSVLS